MRTQPICAYFGRCGGCALQHIQPKAQVQLKQQKLADQLSRLAGIDPTQLNWQPAILNEKTDYRRSARMGVRWHKGRLIVGFRKFASNALIDIEHCPILDQRVSNRLPQLKQCLAQLRQRDCITHLELVLGDNEVALVLRCVRPLSAGDRQILLAFVQAQTWQLYLWLNQGLCRIDQPDALPYLHYQLANGLTLACSPLDFIQVNAAVNQKMVQQACDWLALQKGQRVLDLFCGLGNFSVALADQVGEQGQVVAVEGVVDMVARGRYNAQYNGLTQLNFYHADLSQPIKSNDWAKQPFDAVVLDPPRAGALQLVQQLVALAITRIVYVSCDPATLARDSKILIENGYQLAKIGVMDMFSHTTHIESMALFVRPNSE